LLLQDVAYAEHAVEHLVKVPLTQGAYDALVSFTYNEGAGRLQTSTLLRVLNAGITPMCQVSS
jgi:lysozyme